MLNFEFSNKTKIIFGKNTHRQIGTYVKEYTNKILLIYGGGTIKKNGVYDDIVTSLKDAGIHIIELSGVKPNPTLKLVKKGVSICKKFNIEFILAVGGGSVIDTAKAIAFGVYCKGDIWNYFEKGLSIDKALKIATVLTIPASGSESSGASVITNEITEQKIGVCSEHLRPVFSIINPEIFFTLPENQIANGISDMLSHIMERYFTTTKDTDLIDGLAESVMRTIIKYAPILLKNPKDYNAWCQVGYASTLAHNDLLGVGRSQEWSNHAMEHPLSATYDISHGAGLAIITPSWMDYVYKSNLPIFTKFAVNVMEVKDNSLSEEDCAKEGINRLRQFYQMLKLPKSLKEINIDVDRLKIMAKKVTGVDNDGNESRIGGLVSLGWQDIYIIYMNSYETQVFLDNGK